MYSEPDREHLLRFGARVRALRLAQGYSQEAFADACQLHRTYMGGVERGERNLSLLNIVKIADTLGTTPNILFGAEEKMLHPAAAGQAFYPGNPLLAGHNNVQGQRKGLGKTSRSGYTTKQEGASLR